MSEGAVPPPRAKAKSLIPPRNNASAGEGPRAPAPAEEGWRHFAHGADLGVMGEGKTVEEAFARGALALMRAITDAEVAPKLHVAVACEASDIELLFVEWLNAIIYEMAVRQMLFSRFAVKIEGRALCRAICGARRSIPRATRLLASPRARLTRLCASAKTPTDCGARRASSMFE